MYIQQGRHGIYIRSFEKGRPDSNLISISEIIYDKTRKTGPPNSLARHDMGLSTIIGIPNRDASGHILEEAMRSRMQRLRTWDIRIKTSISNVGNLSDAFNQLHTSKDKLGLPYAIVEKTAYIYDRDIKRRGLDLIPNLI